MNRFVPRTNNVNQDRLYYADSESFIKEDFQIHRGRREAEMLRAMQGIVFIPKIHNAYERDGHHFIRMEMCHGETIENLLKVGIADEDKIEITSRLTFFISALFKSGFYHGDLNDSNIIYDKKTRSLSIIDFEKSGKLKSPDDWKRDIYGHDEGPPWGLIYLLELLR